MQNMLELMTYLSLVFIFLFLTWSSYISHSTKILIKDNTPTMHSLPLIIRDFELRSKNVT